MFIELGHQIVVAGVEKGIRIIVLGNALGGLARDLRQREFSAQVEGAVAGAVVDAELRLEATAGRCGNRDAQSRTAAEFVRGEGLAEPG